MNLSIYLPCQTSQKVHLHPSYSSRKKYNDIALLEMEHAVEYKKTVKPGEQLQDSLIIFSLNPGFHFSEQLAFIVKVNLRNQLICFRLRKNWNTLHFNALINLKSCINLFLIFIIEVVGVEWVQKRMKSRRGYWKLLCPKCLWANAEKSTRQ